MWFRLGIQNFIAKKIIYDDRYDLYISDFTRIWHASLSNNEIVSIFQRLNPLVDAPVKKLKEITSNLFQEEKAEKEITQGNNSITLKLKSNTLDLNYKFQFQIVVYQQNEEIFYKEFTLPLLSVFIQMKNREKKLLKIITEKDTEISEYKQECGPIKCNYVATEPFNKEEFECQDSLRNVCDINSFFECINSALSGVRKEQLASDHFSDQCLPSSSQKFIIDDKEASFKDISNSNKVSQCVKLEHQTIKRRKKQNDTFKIKF